ncbi:MAG: YlxR family protein [Methanomicrobia archaeon]|nr:YlxR family protein [Bacilli bacterium]NCA96545.1 YlxR family protein [Methanomicrobia archaeon]
MRMKKIPMRRCLATNQMFPKKDLLRIVKTPEGQVIIDLSGKANGHGAYLRKDADVFALAKRKRLLDKALQCTIDEALYDQLVKYL